MVHQKNNNNVFSIMSQCDKHKINDIKRERQFIKNLLGQKILSLIPKDKKEEYKFTDDSGKPYYKCPCCDKESTKPLHNSHIGLTRSDMLDYILINHENNPKTTSEYWNEFLEFHKYIEIAVCCSECNKDYEFKTEEESEEELKIIVSKINITKNVSAETLLKEAKETYPDKFKEEEPPKHICSDETNRDFEKFKSDNSGNDNLTQIMEAYDYVTRRDGKLPTLSQAKLYKRYHEGIYEYISSGNLFDKIKIEQTRVECVKELENARKKMKESCPDKERSNNPKYSYPHAILGKLIKYCTGATIIGYKTKKERRQIGTFKNGRPRFINFRINDLNKPKYGFL